MGFTLRITDDRGRERPSAVAGVSLRRRHSDLLDRASLRTIEQSIAAEPVLGPACKALLIALPVFFLPTVYVIWLLPILKGQIGVAWSIAIAIPLGAAGPLVMGLTLRSMMRQRVARAYVRAGFCGCCGFSLEGTTPELDGCSVCPECGAAWCGEPTTPGQ